MNTMRMTAKRVDGGGATWRGGGRALMERATGENYSIKRLLVPFSRERARHWPDLSIMIRALFRTVRIPPPLPPLAPSYQIINHNYLANEFH